MFGYPEVVRVDNGPPFNSREFRNYLNFNDITKKSITPYYPQANGTVERFMRVIKKTVRTAFYENKNWKKELNRMLLNYRTAPHSVTGKSPSYLLFSREINNKLPSIAKEKHVSDKTVRERQADVYSKSKVRFDTKRKVEENDLNVDDVVIMKREKKGDKTEAIYHKKLFKNYQHKS